MTDIVKYIMKKIKAKEEKKDSDSTYIIYYCYKYDRRP